ncbi:MAG: PAS domain S-box protein [Acidobacteria bacterium]|jgi:two-component system nitrogen regulation sensor histidine kinase NtrY|nr:PAS domain S-box protein [Acidobacteriota bacterium]
MRPLTHAGRVLALVVIGGAPAVGVGLWLLAHAPWPDVWRWLTGAAIVTCWLGAALAARALVERPLQTVANLLSALREEDYSFRARAGRPDDPLGEVANELNALAGMLKAQRLGALEATALLRAVMAEIDVAVFAFDEHDVLRLVNRAGERLIGRTAERSLGRTAADLGLIEALSGEAPRVIDGLVAGRTARWDVRRGMFRQHGRPHRLLVLSDVSRALRDEERAAWQRLVRVLGHEINNSLAPIMSISASLASLLGREPPPDDLQADLTRGLGIIGQRAGALGRFTEAYAQIARLPPPRPVPVDVDALVRRVASLAADPRVTVVGGPPCEVLVDPDQVEQAAINLVRNALDAVDITGGRVDVGWTVAGGAVDVRIDDEGQGLAPTANLFVPFFTTKPRGTGIGLVLSRQIAEQNGGRVTLENRSDRTGASARLTLPVA